MRLRLWPEDTIARRFAMTIFLAIMVAVALLRGAAELAGAWGQPPIEEMGLLGRADDIVRMVEAVPASERPAVAGAVANANFQAGWYATASPVAGMLDAATGLRTADDLPGWSDRHSRRRTVLIDQEDRGKSATGLRRNLNPAGLPHAYFLAIALADGGWVVFTVPTRFWGLPISRRIEIGLLLLLVSVIVVSAVATHQLARPIRAFTEALRRFGTDPRAARIPEAGPRELRVSIGAFNAMQAQIQKFVDDRTAMLAAISHDLRTPLTKMRLRGEFVEDEEQRARLFRDVDDMQAMVESALAFFRDDFRDEETTAFDFPELLRTIIDDYTDQGHAIAYAGPEHVTFRGRPFALKRAFGNLVDNAIKYGSAPEIELRCARQRMVVLLRDSGPGIPPEAVERVFAPFYRLEPSRNRATGGVGLGLTSARAVIRGHGGDVTLRNRTAGGLEVEVTLAA